MERTPGRILFLEWIMALSLGAAGERATYQAASHDWPDWHVDARNEVKPGRGWTEWKLVKAAGLRFAGHVRPTIPLWGNADDGARAARARKIDAAAEASHLEPDTTHRMEYVDAVKTVIRQPPLRKNHSPGYKMTAAGLQNRMMSHLLCTHS